MTRRLRPELNGGEAVSRCASIVDAATLDRLAELVIPRELPAELAELRELADALAELAELRELLEEPQ